MSKRVLYIDVDDTLMAVCHPGSGFDLRPGVMTQLRVLSRLFDCRWLTSWGWNTRGKSDQGRCLTQLLRQLYGERLNREIIYCDWGHGHPQRKAGYVLEAKPKDWYWLEDPLEPNELEALKEAGMLDRYIRVEPQGPWGFMEACKELFRRTGITDADIKRVGGKPEWFDRTAMENDNDRGMRHMLKYLQWLISENGDNPQQAVEDISKYLQREQDTRYPISN